MEQVVQVEALTLNTFKQKYPDAYSILIDNINPDNETRLKAEPGYSSFKQIGLALKQRVGQ